MIWKKKVLVGVDLGTYSLKVCSYELKKPTCEVWSEVLLPDRSSLEQKVEFATLNDRVRSMLKDAEANCAPWSKKLSIAVDEPGVSSGYIELPNLSADKLKVALPAALAREIPYPLESVSVFQKDVPALSGGDHKGFFFVTVPKIAEQAHEALVASLGYEMHLCEPGLLSLLRGLTVNHPKISRECLLVLSIGHSRTTLVLMHGGYPYFARQFPIAGAQFTYAFQMADQISWAEAEQKKRKYDVGEKYYAVEPIVTKWFAEVQRSLDFAIKRHLNLKPTSVLLTGGSSHWGGLQNRIAESLKIPASRAAWDSIRPIKANPGMPSELGFYNVVLGLVTKF